MQHRRFLVGEWWVVRLSCCLFVSIGEVWLHVQRPEFRSFGVGGVYRSPTCTCFEIQLALEAATADLDPWGELRRIKFPLAAASQGVRPGPVADMDDEAVAGLLRKERKVAELRHRLGALPTSGLADSLAAEVQALCGPGKHLRRWRTRDRMRLTGGRPR